MRRSNYFFDCVHLLLYKCHKINPNHSGSYIDYRDWIENKESEKIQSIKKLVNTFNTL